MFTPLYCRHVVLILYQMRATDSDPEYSAASKVQLTTRIFLRSRDDGGFVTGAAAWSPCSTHAQVFANARAAAEFVSFHHLKNMELVVMRENLPQLRLPLASRPTI